MLPHDPLNNPLIEATTPQRIAGALRVYARGLAQVIFPRTLSGDYSAPQEPIPVRLVFPESVLGGGGHDPSAPGVSGARDRRVVARVADAERRLDALRSRRRPSSTSRRSWPSPWSGSSSRTSPSRTSPSSCRPCAPSASGTSPRSARRSLLAHRVREDPAGGSRRLGHLSAGVALLALFLGFQCVAARRHAFDYTNDLVFWNATRKAVPRSAKAHLNYSVMLGARGDLPGRLESNAVALAARAAVADGERLHGRHAVQDAPRARGRSRTTCGASRSGPTR